MGTALPHVVQTMLNKLLTSPGHFETAGSLRGGESVFVTMKPPETMTVVGADAMDLYLAATTSHDGTLCSERGQRVSGSDVNDAGRDHDTACAA